MPLKIETVYCGNCHLATPKCHQICVHCDRPLKANKEVIQIYREPKQLALPLTF